jgi:hypothetical protein
MLHLPAQFSDSASGFFQLACYAGKAVGQALYLPAELFAGAQQFRPPAFTYDDKW